MVKVAEVMRSPVVAVSPEDTVAGAARRMAKAGVGALAVVVGDKLVGIITERDIVRKVVARGQDPEVVKVLEAMTPGPVHVPPNASLGEALRLMADLSVRHLPVVDGGKLVGMLSVRDVVSALASLGCEALD